jgi:hypothetical protein
MNGFATVPKSGDLLSYTNGSHGSFVEFYVIEVLKFWVRSLWMTEYGVARA